jgi:hypothetical protein
VRAVLCFRRRFDSIARVIAIRQTVLSTMGSGSSDAVFSERQLDIVLCQNYCRTRTGSGDARGDSTYS